MMVHADLERVEKQKTTSGVLLQKP